MITPRLFSNGPNQEIVQNSQHDDEVIHLEGEHEEDISETAHNTATYRHQDHRSGTLNSCSQQRLSYLPSFPYLTPCSTDKIPFLSANVPMMALSSSDLYRRYGICYDGPFIQAIMSEQTDSFMKNIFKKHFQDLVDRLKINMSLVDFNLMHFQRIVERFQLMRKIFYRRSMRFTNVNGNRKGSQQRILSASSPEALEFNELSIGLEYFLQMDSDLFFMKTCSFRGAQPRSYDEGLFCKANPPSARYCFQSCDEIICSLCESTSPLIEFNAHRAHRFINGYHTLLNCPATCQTQNIIYALTCRCGEYDFIGSTASSIAEMIDSVQENGNRFIHETLLSGVPFERLKEHPDHFLREQNELFRLYEHAARCPKIIQAFLSTNPHYACFIPMNYDQAMIHDASNNCQSISKDHTIEGCVQRVPVPPSDYTFSKFQRQQQYLFFHRQSQLAANERLWSNVDLFHTTVVAVLPERCSTLLREVLQCLFTTHAETKLNMFNLCTSDTQQLYGQPYHRIWCEGSVQ